MLTAFKKVFRTDSLLRFIDHGDKKLVIKRIKYLIGAILINHVERQAVERLEEILDLFEASFFQILKDRPFEISAYQQLPPLLESKLAAFEK